MIKKKIRSPFIIDKVCICAILEVVLLRVLVLNPLNFGIIKIKI